MTVEAVYVQVYIDISGEWRWRARDSNHETVADSGEGYVDKDYAEQAARDLFPDARIDFVDLG